MTPNTKTAELEAEEIAYQLVKEIDELNEKHGGFDTLDELAHHIMQGLNLASLISDKRRLDWLQRQTSDDCSGGWVARQSQLGRGYRLHESSRGTTKDVRTAIDQAMKERQS